MARDGLKIISDRTQISDQNQLLERWQYQSLNLDGVFMFPVIIQIREINKIATGIKHKTLAIFKTSDTILLFCDCLTLFHLFYMNRNSQTNSTKLTELQIYRWYGLTSYILVTCKMKR